LLFTSSKQGDQVFNIPEASSAQEICLWWAFEVSCVESKMDRSWRSVGSNLWNVLTRQYVEVILWQWQGKYWWTMTRKMFFNNSLFMSRSKTSRRRSQYFPSYSSSRKASADDFRVWHWIFHRPVYTDQVPEILTRFSSENLTCWGRFWLGFLKGL